MYFFKRKQQLERELEEYKREYYILHQALETLIEKSCPNDASVADIRKEKEDLLSKIRAEVNVL